MTSSDWEATSAEMNAPAEWRTIAPCARARRMPCGSAFRKAVDSFLERYAQRESWAGRRGQRREAMGARAGEIPADATPEERGAKVMPRRSLAPGRASSAGRDRCRPGAFADARTASSTRAPKRSQDGAWDPEANRSRMEKLCVKVEALLPKTEAAAGCVAGGAAQGSPRRNTRARRERRSRWKATARRVEAAQAAWKRWASSRGAGRVLASASSGLPAFLRQPPGHA